MSVRKRKSFPYLGYLFSGIGFFFFLAFACIFIVSPSICFGKTNPRDQYMLADHCARQLRHSPVRQQRIQAWLACIEQYEKIEKNFPDSSWAPAGMYKAADLYVKLFALSKDPIHRIRAGDLLFRIWKQYPQSAYRGRSKNRFAALGFEVSDFSGNHVRSQKAQTRKKRLTGEALPSSASPRGRHKVASKKDSAQKDSDTSCHDAQVTAMRFRSNFQGAGVWFNGSNPSRSNATRLVIEVSKKCKYSHHLLKKDQSIKVALQRLYIDIEGARLSKNCTSRISIDDDILQQARAGQYQPHTVRVVVDIRSFTKYRVFALEDPFRIVVDVLGENNDEKEVVAVADSFPRKTVRPNLKQKSQTRISTANLKSSSIARQLALGVHKIIIDPGHGGRDPGAPGAIKGVWEKDVVLDLSKILAQELRKRLNCEVILTRTTDKKIPLEERTSIANRERADLFISMHCNAAVNRKIKGIETYLLNLATDERAIAVAARENATSQKNISDLEFILSDLMKHAKIKESSRLANDVQKALIKKMKGKHRGIKDLGVKQAPFYVLLGARMPSILVEAGFLSNREECRRMMKKSYKNDICTGIADGIEAYIRATNPVRK